MRFFLSSLCTTALVCSLNVSASAETIDQGYVQIPTANDLQQALEAKGVDPLFKKEQGQGSHMVIGTENRTRFSDANYPWRAFGKIKFGKNSGWICSGTLVGPRHVATNAHCVDTKYPIYFYPSYNNGNYLNKTPRSTYATYVYWGTGTSDTSSGTHTLPSNFTKENDWAILVLNEPAGNDFGWLGTKSWSSSWLNQASWYEVSYPNAGTLNSSGEYPLYQNNCTVRENSNNYFYHDCDTNGGASGSPLVGTWESKPYIIALNNWEWGSGSSCQPFKAGQCSNGAVMADKFIETLKKALVERP